MSAVDLSPKEAVQLSKLLSYVLRHGAVKEKLTISPDGYIAVNDLLQRPKFKNVTMEQISHVVETNDKKRYELKNDGGVFYIRASQGHSLKTVESKDLLVKVTEALSTPVIHGTTKEAWASIQKQGLSKMNRNHIHFAIGLPDDPKVKSGIRKTSQVFIYIDVEKAKNGGVEFYRSTNDVILSSGLDGGVIPPIYFEKVVDRDGNTLL